MSEPGLPPRRFVWCLLALTLVASCSTAAPSTVSMSERSDPSEQSSQRGVRDGPLEPLPVQVGGCTTDGDVRAIDTADGIAYLGGEFTVVRGDDGAKSKRRNVAACDLDSGAVLDWYPTDGADGTVLDITVDGAVVYVSGEFDRIGGERLSYTARASVDDAEVDPDWAPEPDEPVMTVTLADADAVYVGGLFNKVGGSVQPALARIGDDGSLDASFRPRFGFSEERRPGVFSLASGEGDEDLYVAGRFTSVNGQARSSAAAVDASTGLLTLGFAPQLKDTDPEDGIVQVAQLIISEDSVYLCGDFWQIEEIGDKEQQRNVGRFDARTGAAHNEWQPTTDGGVQDCSLSLPHGVLVIGGHFDNVNLEKRPKLAAISLDDGGVMLWLTTNSTDGVWATAAIDGGPIAVGGAFTTVGDADHAGFAVLAEDEP